MLGFPLLAALLLSTVGVGVAELLF
jgi:hypothetical protein